MSLPTLRQLQYLKLLAEHGSFGRAAEAAHVTQPTLSAGVQELEKILGGPVVDRARSGVILTAVGEVALARATTILNEAEEMVQSARNAGQPLTGRFRLGVIPTVAPYLLPKALPLLRTRFPKLRLYLREDLTHRLIALLKAGQLDAALIALPYDMAGLAHAHVSNDELLAALPSTHQLAHETEAPPSALESDDLILLEDGHCLRDHALAACGLRPPRATGEEEAFAATSLPTLVQMVGSGLGVTFLPAMAVAAGLTDSADVAVMPLKADHPSREIVVAWRAEGSFWDFRSLLGCYRAAGDTVPTPVPVRRGAVTGGIDITVDLGVLRGETVPDLSVCTSLLPADLLPVYFFCKFLPLPPCCDPAHPKFCAWAGGGKYLSIYTYTTTTATPSAPAKNKKFPQPQPLLPGQKIKNFCTTATATLPLLPKIFCLQL